MIRKQKSLFLSRGIWEASERHLRGIWRHLEASGGIWCIWEASGWSLLRKLNTSQLKCKSSFSMSILLCVFEGDINVDGKFTATYAPRQNGGSQKRTMGAIPYRQDPYSRSCLGNNI